MPEQWMYDVMGDEARPRPGFEDELANELHREWRGRRTPWRAIAWGAAAAALLIGVVAVVAQDDNKQIAPADTSLPASVETGAPRTSTSATKAAHVAIGESVMMGAVQLLSDAGVVVDARENRGAQGVARAIEAAVDAGSIGAGTTLLVQVGTNAPFSSAELDDILDAVPSDVDRIVFMTVAAPVDWVPGNNDLIRALPERDPRVQVADWAEASTQINLCPDGIHVSCTREAASYYAAFVLDALGITTDEGPSTTVTSSTTIGPALTGVALYLDSLANGDYDTAARLLNEGGLSLEDRADIRPLFRPEFGLVPGLTNRDAVAAALEKWCSRALCVQPLEVEVDSLNRARVAFPLGEGTRTALFTEYVFEGQEGVYGLPPMLPAGGGDTGAIVDCPTEQVSSIAWADLDGDGWIEQLVAQIGNGDGATSPYTITTCGTALQVEQFEITGDGLAIYSVSLDSEYLLIGFLEGAPNGGVYVFDGQAIVPLQGFDGPARWAFASPIMSDPAETFGCLATDRGMVLVNRLYRLVGGNDLANSTSMELTTVEVLTGVSTSATFDLPEQQAEAGDALMGDCNGLSIQTF